MIQPEANFELTSLIFVGHLTVSLANGQATIVLITEGNIVQNP